MQLPRVTSHAQGTWGSYALIPRWADTPPSTIDELNLSKESLHTISLKVKKSIKAKDIDSIKSKDFKIINKHKETLQNLCDKVKFQNIKKDALKQFVKETCTIDEQGHIFKILMKLK